MMYRLALLFLLSVSSVWAEDRPLVTIATLFAPPDSPVPSGRNRVQLFRVAPAFLVGVPWLESEDPTISRVVDVEPDSGPDWVSLAFGNDNPYLDFRPRGEAGGVGYNRLFSQIQLFDDTRTACSVILQAVTPAGIQFDGVPDHRGATVFTPALSLYHALDDDGTALQLTINKPLTMSNPAAQSFRRDFQCGVAVHTPLAGDSRDLFGNVFVSVEALGQVRSDARTALLLDVLPGVHWKPADNWRISGAMAVPLDRETPITGRSWQITCALQF